MQCGVLSLRHYFQILRSIVSSIAVFVMHYFVFGELTPEDALGNDAVLVASPYLSVGRGAFWISLRASVVVKSSALLFFGRKQAGVVPPNESKFG